MYVLKSNDPIPLYKQIYNQIRERILCGQLQAGARLPSVRELAQELSASRNTVDGAYQELLAEGYIYSRPNSGYYVSQHCQDSSPFPPNLAPYRHKPHHPGPMEYRYDFHPALLAPESFPTALWRTCLNSVLQKSTGVLAGYSDPQGEWELRCRIRKYLEDSRGVICKPEQIVVCAGLQQGLDMVAHLLQSNHSSVAVENPGYHLPRAVFRNNAYSVVPIPVTSLGIDMEALKQSRSTIVYVTPSHQLPLGYVMPVAQRLSLLEWADAGKNYILEDDYDSELRYHGKPLPSLQGLRPGGNVIYLGTFSKVLSPALRISYLVLPNSLLAAHQSMFKDYFSTVSLMEQLALTQFMALGHWDRHIRRMRTIYKKKHDALVCSIEKHFGPLAEIIGQGAGLHVVVRLPQASINEAAFIALARQRGIRLFPYSETGAPPEAEPLHIMLGFGGMNAEELEQGVKLLSEICFSR